MKKEELQDKTYQQLVVIAKKIKVKANGKKDDIIDRIVSFYENESKEEEEEEEDTKPVVKKLKSSATTKVNTKVEVSEDEDEEDEKKFR